MSHRLLALVLLFFSAVSVAYGATEGCKDCDVFIPSPIGTANSFDFSDIIKPDSVDSSVLTHVEDFMKKSPSIGSNTGSSNIQNSVLDLVPEQIKQGLSSDLCGDISVFKGKYLYFFSFGMPEKSIENAIREAIKINTDSGGENVVLVVKGFKDNDFVETMRYMAELMKKPGLDTDLPIEMNPDLFEAYNVESVPVLIRDISKTTTCDSQLLVARGDTGLRYLIEKAENQDPGPHGQMYPVKEESLIAYFKEKIQATLAKMQEADPNEIIGKALAINNDTIKGATEDKERCFDPSITIKRDILDHAGNVFIPKGTRVNPLDHIQLGRYIVIDGSNNKEVQYAMQGNFDKIMIVRGNALELMQTHKRRVFFATEEIIQRFRIEKTPSIITQKDKEVCIREVKVKED